MAFRSISTNNTQATSLVVTPPAGIVDGDILIAFGWSDDGATTFTYPAGFAALTGTPITTSADGMRTGVAIKVASSESGNYTITGSTGICGGVVCFSGRDPSTTPHRSSVANNNSLNASPWNITSAAFGSATSAACDICLIVGSDVANANVDHGVAASGLTERADVQDTIGNFINGAVFTGDAVASGATGVSTVTGTASASSGWSAVAVALAPASGGGGGSGNRILLEAALGVLLLEAGAGALLLEGGSGAISQTLPMQTLAMVATVDVGATMPARTVPMQTFAAQASVSTSGTIAKTVPMQTLAASASVAVNGVMTVTVPMQTLAAAGTVPILATHSPMVPMQLLSSQATVTITGTMPAHTVPMQTYASAASVGTVTTTGTIALTVPMQLYTSAGSVGITGAISRTLPMQMAQMSATVVTPAPPGIIEPAAYPTGATRVVLDASAARFRLVPIKTQIRLDPSKTRARQV